MHDSLASKRQSWFRWQTGYLQSLCTDGCTPTQHHPCLWKDVFLHRSFTWEFADEWWFSCPSCLEFDRGCPVKPQDCIVIIWKPTRKQHISSIGQAWTSALWGREEGLEEREGRRKRRGKGIMLSNLYVLMVHRGQWPYLFGTVQVQVHRQRSPAVCPATAKAKEVRTLVFLKPIQWCTEAMWAGPVHSQSNHYSSYQGANQTFFWYYL